MGLIARATAGDIRALSRLVTLVENRDPLGLTALERLYPASGRAHRIGITGPPGAGKSSLIHLMLREYRAGGRKVAVVAVDPSSRSSGGATLGDRIRLMEHHADPGVFVRSMASRGQRGGLGAATLDVAHILDAVGFDPVIIETLGVGQDEIDIARMVDTTVLVQVPGLGDAVQTLKAGIMEIGDVIAVNKSDLSGATALVRDLRAMLAFGHPTGDGWRPVVAPVSAATGDGIAELVDVIDGHASHLRTEGRLLVRRRDAALAELESLIRADLERRVQLNVDPELASTIESVAERRSTARSAVSSFSIRRGSTSAGS